MDKRKVLEGINRFLDDFLPNTPFHKYYCENEDIYINYYFIYDENLGANMYIEFKDAIICFYFVKLKNEKPYTDGYYSNQEIGKIRIFFQAVLRSLNIQYNIKKSKELMKFKYTEENLIQKVKDNFNFYSSIFNNENSIVIKLYDPVIWDCEG